MEGEGKRRGGVAAMEHMAALASSLLSSTLQFLLNTSTLPSKRPLFPYLRNLLQLLLRLTIVLVAPILSLLASLPPPRAPYAPATSPAPARALAHLLALLARVPVASRKYDLIRALAEQLLDDNLRFSCGLEAVNRAALGDAFSRTIRELEGAVAVWGQGDGGMDVIVGVVRSGLRRWKGAVESGVGAEKLAGELMWMVEKMVECGAGWAAVERWGEARELGRFALSAEPRVQVALVRLSVFLFKYANEENDEEEDDEENPKTHHRMAMLTSWLPLLCRASNGADSPILSRTERAESVKGLEELIQKLGRDHQEEVLALWLHHFAAAPDSDWPNLESCYNQWYAESRKLLLK